MIDRFLSKFRERLLPEQETLSAFEAEYWTGDNLRQPQADVSVTSPLNLKVMNFRSRLFNDVVVTAQGNVPLRQTVAKALWENTEGQGKVREAALRYSGFCGMDDIARGRFTVTVRF